MKLLIALHDDCNAHTCRENRVGDLGADEAIITEHRIPVLLLRANVL
jgi:hypothetical protein